MAATRPIAVANNASAMPGATTARLVFLLAAMAAKECMMPHTVPNRPTKGAVAPTEARKTIQRSIRSISRPTVTVMARSTRSRTPPRTMSAPATREERRHSPIAAPNTAAMGCTGLAPSWSYNSSRLPPDQNRSSNASACRLARRMEVDLLEDDRPDPDAGQHQQHHDDLHDDVGLQEQRQDRQIAPWNGACCRTGRITHSASPPTPHATGPVSSRAGHPPPAHTPTARPAVPLSGPPRRNPAAAGQLHPLVQAAR